MTNVLTNAFPVLAMLGLLANVGLAGAPEVRQDDPLERFWSTTKGRVLRRLPVEILPENAFVSLANADFDEPDDEVLVTRIFRDEIGARGTYNCVTLTLRCRPDLSDKIVREKAAVAIAQAHRDGIKVYMDVDPRIARREFLARWPDEAQARLAFEIAEPVRGTASFRLVPDRSGDHMSAGAVRGYDVFRSRLLKVWAIGFGKDGLADPKRIRDVTDRVFNAECATVISGSVSGLADDEKLVALAEFTHFSADVFSPHLLPFQRELMARYKALGADGGMKDEWGFPPTGARMRQFKSFWYSSAFAAAWAVASGGRDMVDDALLMAVPFAGREQERSAAIDRYFALTERRNAEIERDFYDANKELWGPDVYVTKHSTWWAYPGVREAFHNGLDWWSVKRDWAQTDESCDVGIDLALMRLCGGPCWMNEGYGDDGLHYARAIWRYALCGGRMVFHSLYGDRFNVRDLKGAARRVTGFSEIIDQATTAQSCVRLLNLVSRAQPASAGAFVFGHSRFMNWTDPAHLKDGRSFYQAVGKAGFYLDVYASTALDRFRVDEEGWVVVGSQRYPAVCLHRLSSQDAAAWRNLTQGRPLRTKVLVFDTPGLSGVAPFDPEAPSEVVETLRVLGAVRQTPFGETGLVVEQGALSRNRLPDPDGTLTLLDGTQARIKAFSPSPDGDPIAGALQGVAYRARGLFAVRVENGEAVALAASSLAEAHGAGLDVTLETPADVVLIRQDGRWRGLLQTADPKVEIPAALKRLTDDWRILYQPGVGPTVAAAQETGARTKNGVVFKGVEVFNAVELVPTNGLHLFRRVDARAQASMAERVRNRATTTTGVELRFRPKSVEVKLVMGSLSPSAQVSCHVYRGDALADWPDTTMTVSGTKTVWTFKREGLGLERLRQRARKFGCRYDPEVIRIVLPPSGIGLLDVIGEAEPPKASDVPSKTYLAYGSSITHGSDALVIQRCYASLVGESLGADVRNVGLAGSCCMQPEMADFIAGEAFDYCSLEMGVNTLGALTPEEYERRVRYLVRRVAESHPKAKVLAIDVFRGEFFGDRLEKAATFRRILAQVVKELSLPNVTYVNGLDALPEKGSLSTGTVHPSPAGHEAIAAHLVSIFRQEGEVRPGVLQHDASR